MQYLKNVQDKGIVLCPDALGQPMYRWDGGGMREAILNKEGGWYLLNYDGAMPGESPQSYWNACQARSKDLIHWEKLGPNMVASALSHPESSWETYKDFCSASSPWSFFAQGKWYHYYVGADHTAPDGTPAFWYSTMLATSETLTGLWHKRCDDAGCARHVCLTMGPQGSWNDVTTSPGQIVKNPKWAQNPAQEKRYLMFYSGSCSGVTQRSLGIARSNSLAVSDDFDAPNGSFWEKDPQPILPLAHDIENTSIFREEETGLWWMFTNHIYNNAYTNAIWVYWSADLEHWNPENRAVVVDGTVSSWAHGAIGMPTVIKKDAHTLALLYDAVPGDGTGHLHRSIGLAEISLPLRVE